MRYSQNQLNQFKSFWNDIPSSGLQLEANHSNVSIPYNKKGNKIHIKKENEGKFTAYCNGKVTNACIQKGKNSSDPKIRKRATFVANARAWNYVQKHQWGGMVKLARPLLGKVLRAFKFKPKYLVDVNHNVGTKVNQINPLTKDEITKAFNQAKTFHLNRINGKGWEQRARNAGFTEEEIPKLRQELTTQLNRIQNTPMSEVVKKTGITKLVNNNSNTVPKKPTALHYSLLFPGNKVFHGVELNNPHLNYQQAVDEFVHELGHGMTSGISTKAEQALKSNPRIALESKMFPLTQRLVDYNASLIPKQSTETLQNRGIKASESGLKYILDYVGRGQEQMARSYVGQRHINNLYGAMQKAGKPFNYESAVAFLRDKIPNMTQLNWYGGNADINMYKKALGLATPIGVGLYAMNNQQDNIS